jgi:S1-C subfamily serine protease
MSDDPRETPEKPAEAPQLRREALLPNERSRGLGTVAVVCTMAGVASGLALATTLMAMQVADTMSNRTCTFHTSEPQPIGDHGFLGIHFVFRDGAATVDSVIPHTPAEAIGLHKGDRIITVDGEHIDSSAELQDIIYSAHPGSHPILTIERAGETHSMRPTLAPFPSPY